MKVCTLNPRGRFINVEPSGSSISGGLRVWTDRRCVIGCSTATGQPLRVTPLARQPSKINRTTAIVSAGSTARCRHRARYRFES